MARMREQDSAKKASVNTDAAGAGTGGWRRRGQRGTRRRHWGSRG
jgi:hypothetical protein